MTKRRVLLIQLVVAMAVGSAGCAKLVLQHTPLNPAAQKAGTVALVVNNARPAERGAENELLVGRTRNLYGMPIKFEAENSVVDALRALYTDALANAGYGTDPNAPTQVVVDIKTFFMDGYMGYKIETLSLVRVVAGGTEKYQKEILQNNGFAFKTNKDLYKAYDQLMDMIAKQAVDTFNSPEFRASVQ